MAAPYTGVGNAFGLVYGWGEHVVPADSGFRAEYARIAAIFAVVRDVSMEEAHLARVAKLYGVPLGPPHSLEAGTTASCSARETATSTPSCGS